MFARLVEVQVHQDQNGRVHCHFPRPQCSLYPAQPGFDHGHWFVDRVTSKAISVTFWTNEAAEQASRANIPRMIEGMAHVLSSHDVRQETFETVHEQR